MDRQKQSQSGFGLIEVLLILVLIGLAGFIGAYTFRQHQQKMISDTPAPSETTLTPISIVTFEGTITDKSNECQYDGTCSITVNNKLIITGGGLTPDPKANIYGPTDPNLKSGDLVSVKAKHSMYGYTLQGCSDCYVHIKVTDSN